MIEGADAVGWTVLNENSEKVDAALAEREKGVLTMAANLGTAGKNARIAWGTYTGVGTYGANNPVLLNAGFCPVLAFVGCASNIGYGGWPSIFIRDCVLSHPDYNDGIRMMVQWTDTALSWYVSEGNNDWPGYGQNNVSGWTYYYCVVGYDASGT